MGRSWKGLGAKIGASGLRGQASLEILFAVLVLVACIGIFVGALGKAEKGTVGKVQYWKEKEALSEQAVLAQEYASAGRKASMRLLWGNWKANGNVIASVKNNASVRGVVRAFSDAQGRWVEKNGLEGA